MGAVAKILSMVTGGGKAPKANVAPAVAAVDTEEEKNKRARSALLETAGGQAGAQLQPGQVGQSNTVFGN